MPNHRSSWIIRHGLLAILTLFLQTISLGRTQDGLMEDTAKIASKQFAVKLVKAIRSLSDSEGVKIGKIAIEVQGRPTTAHLQHGIIQSSVEKYLKEQDLFSESSNEVAEIRFRYTPSDGKQPANLSIELSQLINRKSNEKRAISSKACQESQPVMDISGVQLAINSFGNNSENLESFFGSKNDPKILEKLTKPPLKRLRAEWEDQYLFTKDPRNDAPDRKFGFRLEYQSGEPIVPENQDGIPVHLIDANKPFLVGIKNNTSTDFAFEVLIDGYPFLITRNAEEQKVHPYFIFGKEQKHNIGWIVFDPTKDDKYIERYLTLTERQTSSSQDGSTGVARNTTDSSMAGSITVCIYKVEKQTPKGDAKIWLGRPTGRKFDPVNDLQAVGYPKEPISQIVLKYQKKE